jgi:hypothetical protein
MNFEGGDELHEKYFNAVKRDFDEHTVLIIDDSDIAKPCSSKLEGLCKVYDGSTGEVTDGYWYAGVSALTAGRKQPIPVYGRVYSTLEKGYISNNTETLKSLKFLSEHFAKSNIRALDRGYDAGCIFDYFIARKEHFIVRMRGDRIVIFKGEKVILHELARAYKGKYALKFETKNGKKSDCKISIVSVSLPNYPGTPLNLVICRGLGKEPLLLPTNLANDDKRLCVTITKAYLLRWRIEEYYKCESRVKARSKKHSFCSQMLGSCPPKVSKGRAPPLVAPRRERDPRFCFEKVFRACGHDQRAFRQKFRF